MSCSCSKAVTPNNDIEEIVSSTLCFLHGRSYAQNEIHKSTERLIIKGEN